MNRLRELTLVVSPIVGLELQLLYEFKRVSDPAATVLNGLAQEWDLRMAETDFWRVIETAWPIDWTRDPFDRLIVAHAVLEGVPLITRERRIREYLLLALWDEPSRKETPPSWEE